MTQCPECGSELGRVDRREGAVHFLCYSTEHSDHGFFQSVGCMEKVIAQQAARVAELEGERERLTYALDLLADKWGDDSDSASVKPCCGSIYDECVHDLSEYRKMAALAPPEPQPSQEGG
jgi:hypothetical protein